MQTTTKADCQQTIRDQYTIAAAGLRNKLRRLGVPCKVTFSNPPANCELFVELGLPEDKELLPREYNGFLVRVKT
jgi:hypothetical protein